MKKNALIPFLLVFSFIYSIGQDMTKDTVALDEVVVTATKTQRNLREVPARISVINVNTLQSTPSQQVDDILRFTPGLNVYRSTGIYSQRPMVTLRGLSGDEQARTLVLMNGVPINTSDEGGVNWNRINSYALERIELFKGPGSSLYGNNAMGGVINIITKKPSKPRVLSGGVSYGTFNTIRQDLNVGVRAENGFYGSISQYYLKSDGYHILKEADRTPYDIPRSLEEISLSVKAGHDRHDWFKWELQYDVFRDQRGEGFQVYAPRGSYRNFNTNLFRGNLEGGNDNITYDLNLFYQMENYYDVNERMRAGNYSRFDVNSYREDLGALFHFSSAISSNNTMTAGLEIKQGSIEGGDYYQTPRMVDDDEIYDTIYNEGTSNTFAAFIQDEHAFLNDQIHLVLGLRFDQVTFDDGDYYSTDPWNTIPALERNTWSEISPRAGLRFNFIEEVSAYISYSHGFRASILDDLTRTGWMWVGPKYANPDLGPESIDNYELGADIFPAYGLKLSASAYYARGKDFLYYIATGDSLFGRFSIYRRENVTNVTIRGFEADVDYMIADGLSLMAGYAYNDSKIDAFNKQPELENKTLKYVPKHMGSVSLFWRNEIVNTTIRGLFKGKQYADDANALELDPYVTFDVQLSKTIQENYIVSMDILDIFDNKHMETIDYISPGRIITGRLAVKF